MNGLEYNPFDRGLERRPLCKNLSSYRPIVVRQAHHERETRSLLRRDRQRPLWKLLGRVLTEESAIRYF